MSIRLAKCGLSCLSATHSSTTIVRYPCETPSMAQARTPQIVADAAREILIRDPAECTGNAFIDDEALAQAGITDLSSYAEDDSKLALDIFVDGWPEA